ncbi:MAG: DUF1844 domain-containing protein [Ignavibacteria bacterium]|nr:DUF1844 domain-containing protein [Ignavibacteria bacterium]
MNEDKNKQLFLSLVYSFQMQAMIQMGKLQNPVTGEIDRDLDAAQVSIDMIDMLKEKSKNNISSEETGFITKVVSELKMNFVEEKQKPDTVTGTDTENDSSVNDSSVNDSSVKDSSVKDSSVKDSGDKISDLSEVKEPADSSDNNSKDEADSSEAKDISEKKEDEKS